VAPRSPYDRSPGEPELLPSFVCYADILGYEQGSSDALKSGRGRAYLRRLRKVLTDAYARVRTRAELGGDTSDIAPAFDIKVFTDNIVIGHPIDALDVAMGEPELGDLFSIFIEHQAALAMEGFLVRGGIAYGTHYMDDDVVFGGAFHEAVQLDKTGGPPRLALTPSAIEVVRYHISFYGAAENSPHYNDLLEDPDGTIYLNYLEAAFQAFPEGGIFFDVIEKHRATVLAGLKEFAGVPRVRSKYEWTARYHNFICREFAERHPSSRSPEADPVDGAAAEEAQALRDYLIDNAEIAEAPRRIRLTPTTAQLPGKRVTPPGP